VTATLRRMGSVAKAIVAYFRHHPDLRVWEEHEQPYILTFNLLLTAGAVKACRCTALWLLMISFRRYAHKFNRAARTSGGNQSLLLAYLTV